jgi:muramoyltetrapeptide carboxypeptidase
VAPASALTAAEVRAAVKNLGKRGFKVKVEHSGKRRGYLAASDEGRAAALNRLIHDPDVKAIICLRGGYGSPRILDRVDYAALAQHPKIIVGYSDITALLIAVRQRTGLVTFHGPMGKELSAKRGLSHFTNKYYWEALGNPATPLLTDWGGERSGGIRAPITIVGGEAEGVLVGGNLSVICSTVGTPYEIDTRDSILFLEEVAEKPFRIDRMLNQLRLAGKLKQARGILLGAFRGCQARDAGEIALSDIFIDYFAPLGVPVLYEFPAGHVPDHVILPFGVKMRLDAKAGRLTILEPPVAPADTASTASRTPDPAESDGSH